MTESVVGLDLDEITSLLGSEWPAWRARQLYAAVYGAEGSDQALPRALRNRFSTDLPRQEQVYVSSDGTRRYLLGLADARTVEAVLMPEADRDTICISTQVGCPVDCRFCLTALMGLERNLTAGEIVGQALMVAGANGLRASESRLNVVMMGMGEPLLNLANVIKATRLLSDPRGFGLSTRRITMSTAGIIPRIVDLGREPVRPKLAVSLNASTEEQRCELMPITRKYPLADLLEACRAFPLRPRERLTFEYVLLKGVNDSDADARRVVRLLARIRAKVNLIALNPGPGIPYETPERERVLSFQAIVRRSMPCFIRKPRGRDIFAACGQLKRMSEPLAEISSSRLGGAVVRIESTRPAGAPS